MNKLHVDSVIKSFNTKQVLTDVYISCEKGEIIGLPGRNGSGKSTLLKIIFGTLPADSEFVKIGDKILTGLFDSRKLIKYLPQDNYLQNHVKVRSIVDLFCDVNNAGLIKNHALICPILDKKAISFQVGKIDCSRLY